MSLNGNFIPSVVQAKTLGFSLTPHLQLIRESCPLDSNLFQSAIPSHHFCSVIFCLDNCDSLLPAVPAAQNSQGALAELGGDGGAAGPASSYATGSHVCLGPPV